MNNALTKYVVACASTSAVLQLMGVNIIGGCTLLGNMLFTTAVCRNCCYSFDVSSKLKLENLKGLGLLVVS